MPSREEIEAGKSPRGAWTRSQLAQWGVEWPPPAGWKRRLIREHEEGVAQMVKRGRGRRFGAFTAREIRSLYDGLLAADPVDGPLVIELEFEANARSIELPR